MNSGRRCPALAKITVRVAGIEHGVHHGHEFSGRKIVHQQLVQPGQHFARSAAGLGQRAQDAARRRHQQGGRSAFARNVGQNESPAAIGERNEVVPVAAHGTRRHAETGNHKAGNVRRTLRQQRLLNDARFLGFAVQ